MQTHKIVKNCNLSGMRYSSWIYADMHVRALEVHLSLHTTRRRSWIQDWIQGSRMGKFLLVAMTVVLVLLFGRSQALCSPCPFQWWEYQQHCYQYFPWLLPYDQAEQYCRGQHARRYTGGLATVDSLHEMLFLMDYLQKVTNQSLDTNISNHLWLSKADKSYGK